MGGRSSNSRMNSGSSPAMNEYNAANAERMAILRGAPALRRDWPEGTQERLDRAIERMDNAANRVIEQAPDSVYDRGAKAYFDDLGNESTRAQEQIINQIARTNKNGSPSATAVRAANGYANWVIMNIGHELGVFVGTTQTNHANSIQKAVAALIREGVNNVIFVWKEV